MLLRVRSRSLGHAGDDPDGRDAVESRQSVISEFLNVTNLSEEKALVFSEQLRRQWYSEGIVKDRKWHLRKFPRCFVGRQVVSWLIEKEYAVNREEAVSLMAMLERYNLIHHVTDGHQFADQMLFFRFRADEFGGKGAGFRKMLFSQAKASLDSDQVSSGGSDDQASIDRKSSSTSVRSYVGSHGSGGISRASVVSEQASGKPGQPSPIDTGLGRAEMLSSAKELSKAWLRDGVLKDVPGCPSACFEWPAAIQWLMQKGPSPGSKPDATQLLRELISLELMEMVPDSECSRPTLPLYRFCVDNEDDPSTPPLTASLYGLFLSTGQDLKFVQAVHLGDELRPVWLESRIVTSLQDAAGEIFPYTFRTSSGIDSLIDDDESLDRQLGERLLKELERHEIVYCVNAPSLADSRQNYCRFTADIVAANDVLSENNNQEEANVTSDTHVDLHSLSAELDLRSLIIDSSDVHTVVLQEQMATEQAKLLREIWTRTQFIQDRRYHLKAFPNCFIAKAAIDWLISHGEASSRQEALAIMRQFERHWLIHHVNDDHEFMDEMLFFRFRDDDPDKTPVVTASLTSIVSRKTIAAEGSSPRPVASHHSSVLVLLSPTECDEDVAHAVVGGLSLTMKEEGIIKDRRHRMVKYPSCFVAKGAVDWLMHKYPVLSRRMAIRLMCNLEAYGLIHHVVDEHSFEDKYLFFRFRHMDEGGQPGEFLGDLTELATSLFHNLLMVNPPILCDRPYHGKTYALSVPGNELVDFLVATDFQGSRPEAVAHCRDLVNGGRLRSVVGDKKFKDSSALYTFMGGDVLDVRNSYSSASRRKSAPPPRTSPRPLRQKSVAVAKEGVNSSSSSLDVAARFANYRALSASLTLPRSPNLGRASPRQFSLLKRKSPASPSFPVPDKDKRRSSSGMVKSFSLDAEALSSPDRERHSSRSPTPSLPLSLSCINVTISVPGADGSPLHNLISPSARSPEEEETPVQALDASDEEDLDIDGILQSDDGYLKPIDLLRAMAISKQSQLGDQPLSDDSGGPSNDCSTLGHVSDCTKLDDSMVCLGLDLSGASNIEQELDLESPC